MSIARLMQMGAAGVSSGGGPEGWDIDRAYGVNVYPPPSTVSGLYYTGRSVSAGAGTPSRIQMSPDGTKMLLMDQTEDTVEEFTLSTPYRINTASFTRGYSVTAQTIVPFGLWVSPDGTRMAHVRSGTGNVYQYTLNTPWSLVSVTYLGTDVAPGIANVRDIEFSPDGTKMVLLDGNSTNLREYSLSAAFDVATATLVRSRDIGGSEASPNGFSFNEDGTRLFLTGNSGDDINQWTTAIPYSLSQFISNGASISLAAQTTFPRSVFAVDAAFGFYVVGNNFVFEYSNLAPQALYTAGQETNPTGLFISPDGGKLFIIGTEGNSVDQFNLSTPWVVHTGATYVNTRSINAQETSPQDLFFSPDGTKMFVIGLSGRDVNQYTLSTAWNPASGAFNGAFLVSAQDTAPTGLHFSPDGLQMFICGTASDAVHQYSLTTPWEVTSGVSFVRSFSVAAQELTPTGLSFKPDGNRMYICGSTGDDINEYHMTTPWNISTASLVATSVISVSLTGLRGMFFKQDDGTSLYLAGNQPKDASLSYYIQQIYIDPQ